VKLVFALFKYFPFGGLQKDMLTIAQEAVKRGHEVKIFCREWQGDKPPEINCELIEVSALSNHKKNQQFIACLWGKLKSEPYDTVVGFDRIPGVDVYYAADTCFRAKLDKERPFFYRYLPRYKGFLDIEQKLFGPGSNTTVLALAQSAVDEYREAYQTPVKRFHILPPGISKDRINTEKQKSETISKELQLEKDSRVLLFIGSGFKTKGLDRAIRALAELNHEAVVHLAIAGQDKQEHFESLAQELNINNRVHFLGGRKDVPDLLKSADLLVHPARRENTGTVLLEAAVSGLPVICSAVCGYSRYIEENNLGRVIDEPFQQVTLNKVLKESLNDSQQLLSWRENAHQFARTADIYSLPQRALDIIENTENQ